MNVTRLSSVPAKVNHMRHLGAGGLDLVLRHPSDFDGTIHSEMCVVCFGVVIPILVTSASLLATSALPLVSRSY